MQKYLNNIKIPNNITRIKIDIGLAYNAPQTQNWFENNLLEDLFVFGFEPNPISYENILKMDIIKQHEHHGKPLENKYINSGCFCLIPVALSNVSNETIMKFYDMTNDCGTSSLYYPKDDNLGSIKNTINVSVFSLKHFFDCFDWNRFPYIEYIKIDAQGSDYDILLGAGDYLKERIVYITAEPECRQYINCEHNNVNNIAKYLESQGFIQVYDKNTDDPTFINTKYLHLKDDIYIYQRG